MPTSISSATSKNIEALILEAEFYIRAGTFDKAKTAYDSILSLDQENFSAAHMLGMLATKESDFILAASYFLRATKINPSSDKAHYNTGNAFHILKEYETALHHYLRATELNPRDPSAFNNAGLIYHELKRFDFALSCYEKAITINNPLPEAFNNQGATYAAQKKYGLAIQSYTKALNLKPTYLDAINNIGISLLGLEKYQEAIDAFNKVISIAPGYFDAFNGLGLSMTALNKNMEALYYFDRAIELNPLHQSAFFNKANVLNLLGRDEDALQNYEQALHINPHFEFIKGFILQLKMQTGQWKNIQAELDHYEADILKGKKISTPFPSLSLTSNPAIQRSVAEIWANEFMIEEAGFLTFENDSTNQKIRIGYFSADFHYHAISTLLAGLFERHDKNKFEIFAFSFGRFPDDSMRQRLSKAFDRWIDVKYLSDKEIARLSNTLKIDIAVDLGGYTTDSRTPIFLHKAAPIQINFLGYPGTMGSKYYDYIVADETIIPNHHQCFYSEKVIYLPHTYQPNDQTRTFLTCQGTKSDMSLPEEGFVFCCFNNNYKITPRTFKLWMNILTKVPNSVLWLLETNPCFARNIQAEALHHGVSPDRLIFAPQVSGQAHLARHIYADLFLDTSPYNAHTTASDALWMGLPVLTLIGESFAGRVAASLLNAINLPELIAHSEAEYENLAVDLATRPEFLMKLREKLGKNKLLSPLFDIAQFSKNIEKAYETAYVRHISNLHPDHLKITA